MINILHIAKIREHSINGVNVAVPQHVISQAKFANVYFLNVNKVKIDFLKEYQIDENDNLEQFISDKKIDLVVFHEAYIKEFLKISKKIRKLNINYIIIPHGELTTEALKNKKIKKFIANKLLFNAYFKGAKSIQCLSNHELEQTKFPSKFVATNGINMPKEKKELFSENKLSFVYIGRLEVYTKGIDLMLGAINLLQERLRKANVVFKIFGPDAKGRMDSIRNLIKQYNIRDLVFLEHEIIGEKKRQELLDADIFIQTSRTEGMPMGILEALSYGIPCLVTDGTTLGELIEEYNAGWKCSCDVNSIANTLQFILDNVIDYETLSDNSRKLVKDNFQWDIISQNTIEKYKNFCT